MNIEIPETISQWMDDVYSRMVADIKHGTEYLYSVSFMSDQELREAIVDDVLIYTMAPASEKSDTVFTINSFLKFVSVEHRERVIEQMNHPEVQKFIVCENDIIKFRSDDHDFLQQAMDFAGCWYHGFTPPKGTELLAVNLDKIVELGGLDNAVKAMSMELTATVTGGDTVH